MGVERDGSSAISPPPKRNQHPQLSAAHLLDPVSIRATAFSWTYSFTVNIQDKYLPTMKVLYKYSKICTFTKCFTKSNL